MKRTPGTRMAIALLIVAVGAGVALYPTFTDLRYRWYQEFSPQVASAGTTLRPEGGIQIPDGFVAKIEIDAILVSAYIVEGTDARDLAKGPGHYEETPMPGEAGNCCIAGHRTTQGAPFNELASLEEGDEIRTYTSDASSVYRVIEVRSVGPRDVSVVDQSEDSLLTLTTCHPEGSARERLVVVAQLVR